MAFSREHDCCLEPMLRPSELASDPQLSQRGVFFELESHWGNTPADANAVDAAGSRARATSRVW